MRRLRGGVGATAVALPMPAFSAGCGQQALASCTFHVGDEAVEFHTVEAKQPRAEAVPAPLIRSAGRLSAEGVASYLELPAGGRARDHRLGGPVSPYG
ncbi:hypothetical protein ACFYXM_09110 [Streptomyces sp. NPDC002476]|uniref:hypothetical protein n=1 Tax=Streptomyces sp. NPDC002476 TaxID=3364648 RepID=UPI003695752C